ncbi:hypothetical protein K3152_02450 [Qipengyuania sp. 1NDH17]|uniref:Transposase n=1 Tax=Qipengyuania polymorpha TaxID=2867234 RepID=A0ABS7IXT4_9SPHN|nr:hypothetical protein [Qipengyuania polymorpha]MBX7457095.1 hypothetical protein [Qipengyuania polymorpha]
MAEDGQPVENIILHLKNEGFSQGLTSVTLQKIAVAEPSDCKRAVIESEHWRANRNANRSLQNALDKSLD